MEPIKCLDILFRSLTKTLIMIILYWDIFKTALKLQIFYILDNFTPILNTLNT